MTNSPSVRASDLQEAAKPLPAPLAPGTHEDAKRKLAAVPPADTLTPADRYQELFVDVQLNSVFADSKTFVDCLPRKHPEAILAAYRQQKGRSGFDLKAFVHGHFAAETVPSSHYVSDANELLLGHIDRLWPVLTRHPHEHPPLSSLLPLPNSYVVPGGRFAEMYYWDSYFTMLGLAASGRKDLLHAMAENFGYLVDTYGLIPNGTRTYYLSRSQPPVFALMVELFEVDGVKPELHFLPQLRREHAFWMEGADDLEPGQAARHVVRLPDGALLNRYWDERDTPREESYLEDVVTARRSGRPAREVYRELRAGAASGWDFSSRWLEPGKALPSIRTTSILPIDLNSLLYKLETKIAQLSQACGEHACAAEFTARADARREAIERYMWNEEQGAFFDFDWRLGSMRANLTAAAAVPLYVRLATAAQAEKLAATLTARLLVDGGLATTEIHSGEQWDRPNGWAPLQWLAVRGLARYGQHVLAHEIASRWLHVVRRLYRRERKLVEKYVMRFDQNGEAIGGGGGEYPLQDGFGWTNGVTRRLLEQYTAHEAD